jgi:DNA-binding XRE family transcriptional regulator
LCKNIKIVHIRELIYEIYFGSACGYIIFVRIFVRQKYKTELYFGFVATKMEQLIKLGKQVANRREQLRLTQLDIAAIASISDATVRFIEKGKPGVSIANWLKVAGIVGLDLSLTTKKMSDEMRRNKTIDANPKDD